VPVGVHATAHIRPYAHSEMRMSIRTYTHLSRYRRTHRTCMRAYTHTRKIQVQYLHTHIHAYESHARHALRLALVRAQVDNRVLRRFAQYSATARVYSCSSVCMHTRGKVCSSASLVVVTYACMRLCVVAAFASGRMSVGMLLCPHDKCA
jgi:hypothetical protein